MKIKRIYWIVLVCVVAGGILMYLTTSRILPGQNKAEAPATASVHTSEATNSAVPQKTNPMAVANQAVVPPRTIAITNLPDHIRALVENYAYEPQWATAKQLTPADKSILLQLYRQEPSLVKKRGLTIALGFVGDEEVVEVFKHTLSAQYAGQKIASGGNNETNEELVMNATVGALGFLANKSDAAYELLKKGMDPKFWKDYCQFIPATAPDFYGWLAGTSITAIGRSGRPDVTNILESLKPLPLVNTLDNSIYQMSFIGAVVDAAFANDIITTQGLEYYKFLYLELDARLPRLQEWKKQGNGLEWEKWYLKRVGAPPQKIAPQ